MDKSEARKFQMSQLMLLKYFDGFCRENQLTYFLVFGTLLGAIRHKGFIPWDVDIDVAMYRNDYEKVCKLMMNQPNQSLFFEHYKNEKNHISPHAILRINGTHVNFANYSLMKHSPKNDGIYIDIFPIDNVDNPDITETERMKRITLLRRIVYHKTALILRQDHSVMHKIKKIIISVLLSPFSYKYLNAKTDLIMQEDNKKETDVVGILTDPPVYRKQLFPRSVFGDGRQCDFEGYRFVIPEDAEMFLSIRYGDYKKLPPEDERWEIIEKAIDSVDYGNNTFLEGLEALL